MTQIFNCRIRVKFTKICMGDTNPNAVMALKEYNKILENREHIRLLLQKANPSNVCSILYNKKKVLITFPYSINIYVFSNILVYTKPWNLKKDMRVYMRLPCHLGLYIYCIKREIFGFAKNFHA